MRNVVDYIPGVSCPACFETKNEKTLHPDEFWNARSRFCDALVCKACGAEEAFKGFFWREKALQRGFKLKSSGY